MTSDLQILTTSRSWCTTPADYNTTNCLTFMADGSGTLALTRVQTVFAVVTYALAQDQDEGEAVDTPSCVFTCAEKPAVMMMSSLTTVLNPASSNVTV